MKRHGKAQKRVTRTELLPYEIKRGVYYKNVVTKDIKYGVRQVKEHDKISHFVKSTGKCTFYNKLYFSITFDVIILKEKRNQDEVECVNGVQTTSRL